MEKKKVSLLLILLLICSSVFAFEPNSIINYSVPNEIPLNLEITATGKSIDNNGLAYVNQICSFYFLTAETGYLVERANDQYTDQTGRFAMTKFKLTEPDFIRGNNYTLKTICGANEIDANFLVIQRQDALDMLGFRLFPQAIGFDLHYWTNADYIYALMYGVLTIALLLYFVLRFWRN